ncbi:MAG TPA: DNA methyltransferase [Saprospiraceae bacterium]|nr:DNA methyltransferase [Saprospiraceae bacterium]
MSKEKIKWSLVKCNIEDLVFNGYNPNEMCENDKKDLRNSINQFGPVVPIAINIGSRKNTIIGGEKRADIYREMGMKIIDCLIPSRELTLDEEKKLCLRLNKNTGSWNEKLLKEFEMDMLLDVGFGDEELQNFFDDIDLTEDDFDLNKAIAETPIAKVKSGEIYKLGKHFLLVGDSTKEEQVKKLMNDELADIIFQDPPFNIGWGYGGKYGGKYKDKKGEEEYRKFIDNSIETAKKFAKPDSHFFYWSDPNNIGLTQSLYEKHGIRKRRICFWIKSNQNCTPKIAWNRVYEPCTYGTLNKPYLNQNFRNANEIFNQEVTTGNQVLDEIQDMIDIWLVKRDDTKKYLHPTQKPVTLNEKPFKRCSAPGHIIFSGFAGSGSDLIACEELGRFWRGVEEDPIFATIIIDRWEKFTGLKAQKIYENK